MSSLLLTSLGTRRGTLLGMLCQCTLRSPVINLPSLFFNQTLSWQSIMGLFLIVVGVILVNAF